MPSPSRLLRRASAPTALLVLGLLALEGGPEPEPATADRAGRALRAAPSTQALPPALQGVRVRPSEDTEAPAVWDETTVLVRPADEDELAAIARRYGVEVVRAPRASGFAALTVPDGLDAAGFTVVLRADPSVLDAARQGLIRGAAKGGGAKSGGGTADLTGGGGGSSASRAHPLQWHLDAVDAPYAADSLAAGIVVAVADTGVAYEDHADASGTYVQAPSLAGAPIVAPWDFVNDDAHPNDDHGHGTHIASVILSDGAVEGVAPDASLMPLKILDASSTGYEIDLVDAIHHAADQGADVLNLSVSFGLGYVPSRALLEAIDHAAHSGVVLVAAAGNQGRQDVAWPAASPQVLGVGATQPAQGGRHDMTLTGYGNLGGQVDAMAPGGDLLSFTGEWGVPDGILAETIHPSDPTQVGLWLWAGTSQAAAIVSGGVAQMLGAGISPDDVRTQITRTAVADFGDADWALGTAHGSLRIGTAMAATSMEGKKEKSYAAAILPYLLDDGRDRVRPAARISVVRETGAAAGDVRVVGRLRGPGNRPFECFISGGDGGSCTVVGPEIQIPSSGGSVPLAWSFEVESVSYNAETYRPSGLVFAQDDLELLLGAMANEPAADDVVLGLHWPAGDDPELGLLAEAYALPNLSSGVHTSPSAVLFNAEVLALAEAQELDLDLDASGLATSPIGYSKWSLWSFSGSGLSTSPLSFSSLKFLTLSGSGISTSPLLLSGKQLWTLSGASSGADSATTDFAGDPVFLDHDGTAGSGYLGALLDAGGLLTADSYDGASAFQAAGLLDAGVPLTGEKWSLPGRFPLLQF